MIYMYILPVHKENH